MKKYFIGIGIIVLIIVVVLVINLPKTPLITDAINKQVSVADINQKSANTVSQVDQVIKKEEEAREKERKAFEDKGWKEVSEEEPDFDVVHLNPDALNTKEKELQVQLQTNIYSGDKLKNIKEIILKSSNYKTKFVALDSMSRSRDKLAQQLLVELFPLVEEDKLQAEIIKKVRPASIDDSAATFLFSVMGDEKMSTEYREMASLNILSMELATKSAVSQELLQKVPANWLPQFNQLIKTKF